MRSCPVQSPSIVNTSFPVTFYRQHVPFRFRLLYEGTLQSPGMTLSGRRTQLSSLEQNTRFSPFKSSPASSWDKTSCQLSFHVGQLSVDIMMLEPCVMFILEPPPPHICERRTPCQLTYLLLLLYYSPAQSLVMHKTMSLAHEPSSESLHISAVISH